MANTSVYLNSEGERCLKCNEIMELSVCGAQGLWFCFECKEFKRKYNWLGKLINKFI